MNFSWIQLERMEIIFMFLPARILDMLMVEYPARTGAHHE